MTTIRYRPMPTGAWTDPETKERAATSRFRGKVEERDGSGQLRKVTRNPTIVQIESGLLVEARAVGATDVIVEVDLPESAFYADGTGIKGNAREPEFPGVIVHLIGSRFGDLRYACDAFEKLYSGEPAGWHGNLRAVVRTLEALRLVERYGTAHRGEQYAGWAALPPGTPMGSGEKIPLTLDQAAAVLAGATDGLVSAPDVLDEQEDARLAFRMAAKRYHPDVPGGSEATWAKVDEAWQIVERHHARRGG